MNPASAGPTEITLEMHDAQDHQGPAAQSATATNSTGCKAAVPRSTNGDLPAFKHEWAAESKKFNHLHVRCITLSGRISAVGKRRLTCRIATARERVALP